MCRTGATRVVVKDNDCSFCEFVFDKEVLSVLVVWSRLQF